MLITQSVVRTAEEQCAAFIHNLIFIMPLSILQVHVAFTKANKGAGSEPVEPLAAGFQVSFQSFSPDVSLKAGPLQSRRVTRMSAKTFPSLSRHSGCLPAHLDDRENLHLQLFHTSFYVFAVMQQLPQ